MSSSVRVKSTMRAPNFDGLVDSRSLQDAQDSVVEKQIKQLISAGVSPVRGHSRFPGYADPDKYPGKQKAKRPVNLELTGQMLSHYRAFMGRGLRSMLIGIIDSAPESIKNRAVGNNYGTSGAAERRMVPAPGESFKVSVIAALRDVFARAIERRLSRKTGGR